MNDLLFKARCGRMTALEARTHADLPQVVAEAPQIRTELQNAASDLIRDAVRRCIMARNVATASLQPASFDFHSRRGMLAA